LIADPSLQTEVTLVELDHLITKDKIEETDDVAQIVNTNSRITYQGIAEKIVADLPEKSYIQFERLGYFFVDKATSGDSQMELNFVPNGKTKGMTQDSQKISALEASKGKGAAAAAGATDKGKKQEGTGPDGKISKAALKKQ